MKKIYIGEDHPVLMKLIKTTLKGNNFETSFFADGLMLYQKVQEEPPDLMVLDIIMPSLNGLAISRLVKFNTLYQHIPIIVMSSITDQNIKEQATKFGASAFLPKPFKINELKEIVIKYLPD